MHYIYYLSDPRDETCRWVGCANNPDARLDHHITQVRPTAKSAWIQELLEFGMIPVLKIACIVETKHEAHRVERALIGALRKRCPLTNAIPGVAQIGKVVSEEARAKMSISHTGLVPSDAARMRMSQSALGRVVTETTREKLRAAHLGKTVSEEGRANMRKAWEDRRKNADPADLRKRKELGL